MKRSSTTNYGMQESPASFWKGDSRWQRMRLVAKWKSLVHVGNEQQQRQEGHRPRTANVATTGTVAGAVPSLLNGDGRLLGAKEAMGANAILSLGINKHPSTELDTANPHLPHVAASLSSSLKSYSPFVSNQCKQLSRFPPELVFVHSSSLSLNRQDRQPKQRQLMVDGYQDTIIARKRKRAQNRRQAWKRLVEQQSDIEDANEDNEDGSKRSRRQAVDVAMDTPPFNQDTSVITAGNCNAHMLDTLIHQHSDKETATTNFPSDDPSMITGTIVTSTAEHASASGGGQQAAASTLSDTISALADKLESVQPAGSRPSDIRASITLQNGSSLTASALEISSSQKSASSENGDVMLSQTQHSQQSVALWEDIQVIMHALCSKVPDLERQAAESIALLGLDQLDDGVLHGLCVNEMATCKEDDTSPEQGFLLSYQTSLYLFHILLFSKARELTSTPSRLLLDTIQSATRLHARAVMDGVLLPLICCSSDTVTKVHMDFVFNILKGQAANTITHFLGEWLVALTNPAASPSSKDGTLLSQNQKASPLMRYLPCNLQLLQMQRSSLSSLVAIGGNSRIPGSQEANGTFVVPTPFSSEIQISLLQSIVSLPALAKSPLPTRLWHQLCEDLEVLWSCLHTLISQLPPQQQQTGLGKSEREWAKVIYLPSLSSSTASTSLPGEGMRLSNAKLTPVLVLWILRHGPSCQDFSLLQRLQQFCETKLDVKGGKMILPKIEALLKKKAKQVK